MPHRIEGLGRSMGLGYATGPDLLIGAGGWQYFFTPGDRLANYSRCFRFVEVNSSFYSYIPLRVALNWRRRVPRDFAFSVRAHRDITHKYKLGTCDEVLRAQIYMRKICEALGSSALVYTTPPSFGPTEENLRTAERFFAGAEWGKFSLVWETRGKMWWTPKAKAVLRRILRETDVTHSADLSYQDPVYANQLVYSRIFGPAREVTRHGQYSIRDSQLERTIEMAGKFLGQKKRIMISFHSVRMYEDAARMIKRAQSPLPDRNS
jgi:uncharacterized protein YecE (DUF72 family)